MLKDGIFKKAQHNPPHLFLEDTLYMLTASTYQKQAFLNSDKRKLDWISAFLKASEIYQWEIIAWVVLHNHYHAIVRSPKQKLNMAKFIASYHKFTARKWNQEDQLLGRKVWWNYWDTCIRSEKDYLARLNYIFLNPVKHGIVNDPENYPFSNYKDFLLVETWAGLVSEGEINDVPEF
jgi:putative transposase